MSLGPPLGIDITADTGTAVSAIEKVNLKLAETEQRTRRATLAAKDWNEEMGKQLKAGAHAARGVRGGEGLAKAGEGVERGGVMGMLSVAAGIGSTLIAVAERFNSLSEESAHRRLEIEEKILAASEKALTYREASAKAGLGQEDGYRRAMAAGGSQAIHVADDLMLNGGFSPDEAYGVAAATGGALTPKARAILIAIRRRGGDTAKAADTFAKRPWMGDISEAGWNSDFKDSYISYAADSVASVSGGKATGARNDALLADDKFLTSAERDRKIRGETSYYDRDNAAGGAADAGLYLERDRAKQSGAAANTELAKDLQHAVDVLSKQAASQGRIFGLLADVFKPTGSFETQLARLLRDQNHVINGDH